MAQAVYVKAQGGSNNSSFISYLFQRKLSSLILFVSFTFLSTVLIVNFVANLVLGSSDTYLTRSSALQQVKGVEVENVLPTQVLPPTPTPQPPTPIATPTPSLAKRSYTIAIIGDSMVDTMGERLEYLEHALKKKYPETTFFLYNYGKGSENVSEGIARFSEEFKYKDRNFPPLPKIQTDIIIIGSYGYNPLYPFDRDRHWLTLTQLVNTAKQKKDAEVYMLAEIAPLVRDFGRGPGGVDWPDNLRYEHAQQIIQQLENAVSLSRALGVPLVNSYEKSIDNQQTKEGKRELVNSFDGIHPSVKGHEFIADAIVEALKFR
ncbi:hypothetical protein HYT33_00620 [Candidatus Roizmanbacteria bacterium]|nr:hypothetical protein [Candidatus Roizmanbacteria bacterium]